MRASGTEALVRVMVEGVDADKVELVARQVADVIRAVVGES